MKRRTFQMLGGAMAITLAGEAVPHLATAERCVGTTEEITLCGPSERMLERRLDHAPEGEFEAFDGRPGGYVASGAANSITTSTSSSQNPLRHNPGGTLFIGGDR